MTVSSAASPDHQWEKVVIHLEEGVVKGFLQSEAKPGERLDDLLRNVNAAPPTLLRIRRLGATGIDEISVEQTKAIFFVKEFDGNPGHKDLRFYRGSPIGHGVWVRLEFNDGEIMEGLVFNSLSFLVEPGFFMRPTDPDGNNRLVYVTKSWLKGCRVLGLRNI